MCKLLNKTELDLHTACILLPPLHRALCPMATGGWAQQCVTFWTPKTHTKATRGHTTSPQPEPATSSEARRGNPPTQAPPVATPHHSRPTDILCEHSTYCPNSLPIGLGPESPHPAIFIRIPPSCLRLAPPPHTEPNAAPHTIATPSRPEQSTAEHHANKTARRRRPGAARGRSDRGQRTTTATKTSPRHPCRGGGRRPRAPPRPPRRRPQPTAGRGTDTMGQRSSLLHLLQGQMQSHSGPTQRGK